MTIETLASIEPIIKIDGNHYIVNIREYESLLKQCEQFMETDGESMLAMTQTISDQLIDSAKDSTRIAELRPQLKFLRELGFFLKVVLTPAD